MIKQGQFYKNEKGNIYLLAQVEYNKMGLVGLASGNLWNDSVEVADPQNITLEEWEEIRGKELREDCEYYSYEFELAQFNYSTNF